MKLEEVHDCENCHDKMVTIEVDIFGNTYCGYCHERVDYPKLEEVMIEKLKEKTK